MIIDRNMVLAPGVIFDEAKHEYWYKGKKLSGITGLISQKLGLKYNGNFVGEHTDEGIHVHKAVQRWIETGDLESVHPGVQWLVNSFPRYRNPVSGASGLTFFTERTFENELTKAYSEVLVSDFKQYASAVDIITERDAHVVLYDIKKGKFNREYTTWQLSIYKYFIEKYAGKKVVNCVCICLKDKEYYPIFPKPVEQVEKLLYASAA